MIGIFFSFTYKHFIIFPFIRSTSTTKLNLSTFELTDDDCKVIGSALRKDVFLQELDLSNCMLNDDGIYFFYLIISIPTVS